MNEELRYTSRETANKHRHEDDIHVGDRVLISLRKHDAATLSALPRGTLAPHFAGPFVVLQQTASNAFQLDLPDVSGRAHVHDVFVNVNQLKTYRSATPKIDSLESNVDYIGNWDDSLGLESAKAGTDQHPLPPFEVHGVLAPRAPEPRAPPARIARPPRIHLADTRTRKTMFRQYRKRDESISMEKHDYDAQSDL